jgi:hypothetical protein
VCTGIEFNIKISDCYTKLENCKHGPLDIPEIGIHSTMGNRTYTPTTFSKDEILQSHASVLNTLNIPGHVDDYELPFFYWIPKLHNKTPYKQRYIAGSKKCSTKFVNTRAPYKNINCCEGEASNVL